jgi:hypothetical protein
MTAPLSFFGKTSTGRYGELSICLVIRVDWGPKNLDQTCSPATSMLSSWFLGVITSRLGHAQQRQSCLIASPGHSKLG